MHLEGCGSHRPGPVGVVGEVGSESGEETVVPAGEGSGNGRSSVAAAWGRDEGGDKLLNVHAHWGRQGPRGENPHVLDPWLPALGRPHGR